MNVTVTREQRMNERSVVCMLDIVVNSEELHSLIVNAETVVV